MKPERRFTVRKADWSHDEPALKAVRFKVFVTEQGVPDEMECDGEDATAVHFLAEDGSGTPIGTARLVGSGQIGRMAVLKPWRRTGVGKALLRAVLDHLHTVPAASPFLNAQVDAIEFYRRQGFRSVGETFMEAGIAHKRMVPRE
jgi:predicted GNAT family N-acyltransferase